MPKIWSEEELDLIPQSREKLSEYFTGVANAAFKRMQAAPEGSNKRKTEYAFFKAIYNNLDSLIESSYEGLDAKSK